MSIRHCKQQTSRTSKRHVRSQANEVVAHSVVETENNTNIVSAVVTAGKPIVYFGYDYLPWGTAQYDLNA